MLPAQRLLRETLGRTSSIDIYLTYRCDMRCSHCFVGPLLDTRGDMPASMIGTLLVAAAESRVEEVTFLGGEPTLYPDIVGVTSRAFEFGMKVRYVSNGAGRLEHILGALPCLDQLHVCFSIDGGSSGAHDAVRRKGSFELMRSSSLRCRALGIPTSAITSLAKFNVDELDGILRVCEELGFEHLNVHYVSARGFASSSQVLGVKDWLDVAHRVRNLSATHGVAVRFEETFSPKRACGATCAAREGRNLMFFPDGRVFQCALFIDMPRAHSYRLTDDGCLELNEASSSERLRVAADHPLGCPAASVIYGAQEQEARNAGLRIGCIYDKTVFQAGDYLADFRGHMN